MMGFAGVRGVDERVDAAASPPGEISFRNLHRGGGDDDDVDDDTAPSELSTLMPPSTLTPCYGLPGYDPELHRSPNPNRGVRPSLIDLHPSEASESHPPPRSTETQRERSRKAFHLVLWLGLLSVGGLLGADVVYIMVRTARPASGKAEVSQNIMSSAAAANAAEKFDVDSPAKSAGSGGEIGNIVGAEPELLAGSRVDNGGGRAKASKRAKAKKSKTGKDGDNEEGEEEGGGEEEEAPATDIGKLGEAESKVEDDELIVTTTQRQAVAQGGPVLVAEDVSDERGREETTTVPEARERCPYVISTFEEQNADVTNMDFLRDKYLRQSVDPNVFYRATALLFWKDLGSGSWGRDQNATVNFEDLVQLEHAKYEDGTLLSPMSTWTWITGDQHLSNFGAWRNRGAEVVFSVNDFDEGAIYDFHMDVLRIAVSICSHGFTNGLDEDQIREALEAFTYTYVKTAIDYVGGDTALVFELNPHTSTGALRDFLWDVQEKRSHSRQMSKFTELGADGALRLVRGGKSRLVDVPPEIEAKVRAEITSERYGASMMKMGWKVREWNDDFFTVLDVARRVGSGVGSYGVDRFYVLLKGEDSLLDEDQDGASVILDVKFEPKSAVSSILEEDDDPKTREWRAWYGTMFRNEADRAAQAQRKLTSYTDPYVGYLVIDGNSYNVRQRSPYKSSFDYSKLTNHRAFREFMEQIAVATATAHVRGTVAKSPGQFKHVIKLLLAGDRNRRRWSDLVARIAFSYRKQVLLDFECFKGYVERNFSTEQ